MENIDEAQRQQGILKKYGVLFGTAEDTSYRRNLLNGKGRHLAYQTDQKIGGTGINIVNGLALGCDTEEILKKGGCV